MKLKRRALPLPARPAKAPRSMGLKAATTKAATIRANTVHRHKQHTEALAMADQIRRAQLYNQQTIEHDHLLGASLDGKLQTQAYNRLQELIPLIKKP